MLPLVFIFIPVLSFSEYFYLKRDNSASNCAPSWKGGGRGGWRELGVRSEKLEVSLSPPNLPFSRGGHAVGLQIRPNRNPLNPKNP
jgi:hypothetical protein